MTTLSQASRPWVAFNATDKQHRKYYNDFLTHRSWGTCPVRFTLDEESGDVISMIERDLARFYLTKEFE